MKKDLISVLDLEPEDIQRILDQSRDLKLKNSKYDALEGKNIGIILEKPSTRTVLSFVSGIRKLSGFPVILGWSTLQAVRGESLSDTAKMFASYLDAVIIRIMNHENLVDIATHSSIPVINGLTSMEHPCQILSDLFTIAEQTGIKNIADFKNIHLAYIGDGRNNIANSWIGIATLLGFQLSIASPDIYAPNKQFIQNIENKLSNKLNLNISSNIRNVVKDADFIYTDVWTSLGKEDERNTRVKNLKDYTISKELMSYIKPKCVVMHCLPVHRNQEISSDVFDSERCIALRQAKNRIFAQQSILLYLMEDTKR